MANNNVNGGSVNVGVNYQLNQRSFQTITNSFNNIKAQTAKLNTAFAGVGKAVIAAFSITAITRFAKAASNLYKQQLVAETKLETVMRQRMGATDAQIQKIKDLASEYQNLGLVGDEVALAGMAQLATFAKSAKTLETILPNFENALVGMYGMDVTQSGAQSFANQLGKALSNGTLSSLSRSGLTFTEAEKNAFKMANEIERAEILSRALEKNYGKVNEELAKTPYGRIQQVKNAFGDLKELFGKAFTNIAATFVPILQTILSFLNRIAVKLVEVSELVYKAFGGVISKNKGAVGGLSEIAEGFEEVGSAASGAKDSMASFDNVVQLADTSGSGGGSGSSGGILDSSAVAEQETLVNKVEQQISGLKGAFDKFVDDIRKKLKDKFDFGEMFDFSATYQALEDLKTNSSEIIKDLFPNAYDLMTSFTANLLSSSLLVYTTAKDIVELFVEGVSDAIQEQKDYIIKKWKEIFDNLTSTNDNLIDIKSTITDIIDEWLKLNTTVQTISNLIQIVTKVFSTIMDWVTRSIKWITGKVKDFLEEHKEEISKSLEKISAMFESFTTLIKDALDLGIAWVEKNIMPQIEDFCDFVASVIGGVVEWLIKELGDFGDFFKGLFDLLDGILTQDLKKTLQGVKLLVAGVINGIIHNFEGLLNTIIKGINSIIRAANKVDPFGDAIPEIKTVKFNGIDTSKLADGGIVYRQTNFGNFIAGEAGAEAIIPLENSNYTKTLASEIVKGMKEAGFGGGDTFNIENAFGDDRSMERLVNRIEAVRQRNNARKGAVSYA